MVRIDQDKKELLFIPDTSHQEHPPRRNFALLSAYVCPFCRRILAAYFQGFLSDADITYYSKEEGYVIGSVPGGHYLKLESHQGYSYYGSEKCSWELFARRGVVENLRMFTERYEFSRMLVQRLSERIREIPGFVLVEDVCEKDGVMLLFSEEKLFEEVRAKEGFDAYWEAKQNLGEYLVKLMSNDDVIHDTTNLLQS